MLWAKQLRKEKERGGMKKGKKMKTRIDQIGGYKNSKRRLKN